MRISLQTRHKAGENQGRAKVNTPLFTAYMRSVRVDAFQRPIRGRDFEYHISRFQRSNLGHFEGRGVSRDRAGQEQKLMTAYFGRT